MIAVQTGPSYCRGVGFQADAGWRLVGSQEGQLKCGDGQAPRDRELLVGGDRRWGTRGPGRRGGLQRDHSAVRQARAERPATEPWVFERGGIGRSGICRTGPYGAFHLNSEKNLSCSSEHRVAGSEHLAIKRYRLRDKRTRRHEASSRVYSTRFHLLPAEFGRWRAITERSFRNPAGGHKAPTDQAPGSRRWEPGAERGGARRVKDPSRLSRLGKRERRKPVFESDRQASSRLATFFESI